MNEGCDNKAQLAVWSQNRDTLFVILLKEMANHLNYDIDDVHLKKAVYIPRAHGDEEARGKSGYVHIEDFLYLKPSITLSTHRFYSFLNIIYISSNISHESPKGFGVI